MLETNLDKQTNRQQTTFGQLELLSAADKYVTAPGVSTSWFLLLGFLTEVVLPYSWRAQAEAEAGADAWDCGVAGGPCDTTLPAQ